MSNKVILYGSAKCHKTMAYQDYLSSREVNFTFLDVVANMNYASELRGLYKSGKLNFPTLMVGHKKLRNPEWSVLNKWLNKLNFIGKRNNPTPFEQMNFTCGINPSEYYCGDSIAY